MAFITTDNTVNIVDLVGPLMLDCPVPIAAQGILWAAIELCRRSMVWAEVQTITVAANDVQLNTTQDANVSDVTEVYWTQTDSTDGSIWKRELTPCTREYADWWQLRCPSGNPDFFFCPSKGTLRLVPAPTAAATFQATLILIPMRNSQTLPSLLFDNYWETLRHGSLYQLMSVPNRPWTNLQLADFHRGQFEVMLGSLAAMAAKDGTKLPLRSQADFTVGNPNWTSGRRRNYWRG